MPDFRLPDLGEGVTEGEIDRWLVKEGDVIDEDTPLVEIITDKATAEIPSPFAGTVVRIHHGEGEVVPVGNVLITIGDASEATQSDDLLDTAATEARVPSAPPPPPPREEMAAPAEPVSTGNGKVKAMPPVRKLARDLGVDLTAISGSGPEGRILREDVEAAASAKAPTTRTQVAAEPRRAGTRIPMRGVRRMIAEKMLEAHRSIPPVTHVEECDVTALDDTRRALNERYPDRPKLSYLPFIITATVKALRAFPELNSSLDDEAQEIVLHDHINIGFATDTPQGLVVPVIKDADQKTLHDLAGDLQRLAADAREGRIKADELRGGTFTITSPGKFAGLMATPIIMAPQAAILGVHRAVERPWVVDGQIVIRKIMNISVTFDHRVMDGMSAARFNQEIVALLENPALLFYDA
ncbi:MAG TPA: dihydrolipoamide acetyltransferase family protein [Actinomycetota bacterium]|nr:dihydrolipoamide acetyltransferase family protein [Actinomycetota bacterium]